MRAAVDWVRRVQRVRQVRCACERCGRFAQELQRIAANALDGDVARAHHR